MLDGECSSSDYYTPCYAPRSKQKTASTKSGEVHQNETSRINRNSVNIHPDSSHSTQAKQDDSSISPSPHLTASPTFDSIASDHFYNIDELAAHLHKVAEILSTQGIEDDMMKVASVPPDAEWPDEMDGQIVAYGFRVTIDDGIVFLGRESAEHDCISKSVCMFLYNVLLQIPRIDPKNIRINSTEWDPETHLQPDGTLSFESRHKAKPGAESGLFVQFGWGNEGDLMEMDNYASYLPRIEKEIGISMPHRLVNIKAHFEKPKKGELLDPNSVSFAIAVYDLTEIITLDEPVNPNPFKNEPPLERKKPSKYRAQLSSIQYVQGVGCKNSAAKEDAEALKKFVDGITEGHRQPKIDIHGMEQGDAELEDAISFTKSMCLQIDLTEFIDFILTFIGCNDEEVALVKQLEHLKWEDNRWVAYFPVAELFGSLNQVELTKETKKRKRSSNLSASRAPPKKRHRSTK